MTTASHQVSFRVASNEDLVGNPVFGMSFELQFTRKLVSLNASRLGYSGKVQHAIVVAQRTGWNRGSQAGLHSAMKTILHHKMMRYLRVFLFS